MPIPYNIWGGEVLWLTYGYGLWVFGSNVGGAFSWVEANIPPQDEGKRWTTYQVLGFPEDPPTAPHFNPDPWAIYPGSSVKSAEPYGYLEILGYAYDPVRGVITHFLMWDDPNAYPDHDWDTYATGIVSHLAHGLGEVERFIHTYSGAFSFDDPTYGLEVLNPGAYEAFKYAFSSEGGQPLLVMSRDEGVTVVSWDWGENWSTPVWPSQYYPDTPWDGGCFTFSEVCMGWGPEGSDTFCVAGGNDIWRSTDNGQSMDITYAPYDALGDGLWDPARCNAIMGDTFTIQCNHKQDPDCVWMGISYYALDNPEHWVQRNTTPTCEPEGWESEAFFLVSEAFQDDIFEGTCFYPMDHPTVGFRGDPYTPYPLTIGMSYLPGTDRWWAYGMGHNRGWVVFSEDDGKTWSKHLCDHANEQNWINMHPFLSPRLWPWSESYALYQQLNGSGWWDAFYDIVEHPDDPNIVLSLGECWLKTPYAVGDPAGRFGGTFEPVRKVRTEEAEFLKYPEYNPYGHLEAMGGNENACISISRDGGLTWDHPFSVVPFWDFGDWDTYQSRLVAIRR